MLIMRPGSCVFGSSPRVKRVSLTALLVKVMARMAEGATPVSTRWRILSAIVLVLPAPAPAKIKTGPRMDTTAFFCSEFKFREDFDMLDTIAYGGIMNGHRTEA